MLEDSSTQEARVQASYYTRGREASTIATYNTEYRRLVRFCQETGRSLFNFKESDLIQFIVTRSKAGASEGQLKQGLAVVNLICEVCKVQSPTKSEIVAKVKLAAFKDANEGKRKIQRRGLKMTDIKMMMKKCYRKDASKVKPERRRMVTMLTFCYFGCKRFSDINKIKKKDVVFMEDDSIKVWVSRSKTDKKREGYEFSMSGKKSGKFSVRKLVKWYFKSLGNVPDEGYIFPKFRKFSPLWDSHVTYGMARAQLEKEKEVLGLDSTITWHSGRIGSASRAAEKGVSRDTIKKCGHWVSDAVDLYTRVDNPGIIMSDRLLED